MAMSRRRSRGRCGLAEESTSEGRLQVSTLMKEANVVRNTADSELLRKAAGACAPNFIWREKVTQWCYDVVDHLGESRDVVYVAMNILDRYCVVEDLCQKSASEKDYEQAALTALFLAIRISGSADLDVVNLVRMSRHGVQVQEVVSVGKIMTEKLYWETPIITPLAFVKAFLHLLPSTVDIALERSLLDASSYLVQLSVCDAFFSGRSAALIALASILNSIVVDGAARLTTREQAALFDQVYAITGIDARSSKVETLCSRLQLVYARSEESQSTRPHVIPDSDDTVEVIPPQEHHLSIASATTCTDVTCKKMTVTDRMVGDKSVVSPVPPYERDSKRLRQTISTD